MNDMRILGNLVLKTREKTQNSSFSGEDIVKRCNFEHVSEAISDMSIASDGTMKAGLKVSIGYILKKLVKVLKREYLMRNDMEKMQELELFSTLLSYNWDFIFFTPQ